MIQTAYLAPSVPLGAGSEGPLLPLSSRTLAFLNADGRFPARSSTALRQSPCRVAIAAGYAAFAVSYLVFALGKLPGMKIDHPGMAIIGAVLMVDFRVVPSADALRFIDFGTLVLLFSMMLVVGCLHLTGFFEWITEQIITRLKPRHLLPTVIFITGVLSAFFVNDIICLVMVPFVLTAVKRMGLKPMPYLLAVATSANIGSVQPLPETRRTCSSARFPGSRTGTSSRISDRLR